MVFFFFLFAFVFDKSNEFVGVACNSLQDAVNVKYLDPDSMCRNMYNATQTRKTIISIQDDDESEFFFSFKEEKKMHILN